MISLEASSLFATIVGLICNWKSERASIATDRYQDFMVWLVQHNFNDLNNRIFASEELQHHLSSLLSEDISVISTKLDTIVGSLSAVADKIDTLSQLGRTLGADTEALSEQATEILKIFDQTRAFRMIHSLDFHACVFDNTPISFDDVRFLASDVASLEKFAFIRLVDHNNSGDPVYAITRQGSAFAQQLPEIPL